jgi:murein L,D-transpeptidase YafK
LVRLAPLLFLGILIALGGCATKPPEPPALSADRVVVKKAERKLQLLKAGQVVREYRVNLGDNPYGHKERQGDERTPEGDYILDWRNPRSLYHKSIHVSYPNAEDAASARVRGLDPGGMIMIHGRPNYIDSPRILAEYDNRDWTNGCIAVKNAEMDEIWKAVRDGTPIRILP